MVFHPRGIFNFSVAKSLDRYLEYDTLGADPTSAHSWRGLFLFAIRSQFHESFLTYLNLALITISVFCWHGFFHASNAYFLYKFNLWVKVRVLVCIYSYKLH